MKFLLFAVFLTAVYSWEDLVDSARGWLARITKKQHIKKTENETDHFVGTVLFVVWIPISMLLFLLSNAELPVKLGWLIAQLLFISLFLRGLIIFKNRMSRLDRYSGWEKTGLVLFSLAGLVSPAYKMIHYNSYYNERLVAKFAAILSLPAIAGLAINLFLPSLPNIRTDILPNINQLIIVMVGGIFILITIQLLENLLAIHPFKIFSFVRIVLGLFLFVVLINGVI